MKSLEICAFATGLIGPLVICKKGSLQSSGIPKGYDSERYVLMGVIDENKSWYLDQSMNRFCYVPGCFNIDKGNCLTVFIY